MRCISEREPPLQADTMGGKMFKKKKKLNLLGQQGQFIPH